VLRCQLDLKGDRTVAGWHDDVGPAVTGAAPLVADRDAVALATLGDQPSAVTLGQHLRARAAGQLEVADDLNDGQLVGAVQIRARLALPPRVADLAGAVRRQDRHERLGHVCAVQADEPGGLQPPQPQPRLLDADAEPQRQQLRRHEPKPPDPQQPLTITVGLHLHPPTSTGPALKPHARHPAFVACRPSRLP